MNAFMGGICEGPFMYLLFVVLTSYKADAVVFDLNTTRLCCFSASMHLGFYLNLSFGLAYVSQFDGA